MSFPRNVYYQRCANYKEENDFLFTGKEVTDVKEYISTCIFTNTVNTQVHICKKKLTK